MPTYEFTCNSCKKNWDDFLTMSECNKPLTDPCPNCSETGTVQRVFVSPLLGTGAGVGKKKIPRGFNDVLDKIQKANPLGTGIKKHY